MTTEGRRIAGYVIVGLIGLAVGYFVGREHLKYEMRSTVQSATQELQRGIGSAFSGGPAVLDPKSLTQKPARRSQQPTAAFVSDSRRSLRANATPAVAPQPTFTTRPAKGCVGWIPGIPDLPGS